MNALTGQDTETLTKADDETLAVWWCTLNRWGWPTELAPEEIHSPRTYTRRARDLMRAIEDRIGLTKCLAEWNIVRFRLNLGTDSRTDAEWNLRSRERTREAAFQQFRRDREDIRTQADPLVKDFTIDEIMEGT